ncbi:hypothetical protein AL542_13655 [Grimontia hollisae]|uniref:hypothetical protein n=1 Tax=Grimontia hollisae TaxID=673 RepID=UPI000591149A|nr:hypothetical protein [Grimontia hollisae]AMG31290.1 hypothetical protein AL542_13655 [Grimontia hollisae]STO46059.1 Uncharacterised protein [Grimontia hollisae]STQ76669.1 Uncharacterised protein [Grimontia hollisae]
MKPIERLCYKIKDKECQSALKSGNFDLAKNILRIKQEHDKKNLEKLKDMQDLFYLKGLYENELNTFRQIIITKDDMRERNKQLIRIFNHELSLQSFDCERKTTVRFDIPKKNKSSMHSMLCRIS